MASPIKVLFKQFILERCSTTEIYNYLIKNSIPSLTSKPWTFDSIRNCIRAIKSPEWRSNHPILKDQT